MDADDVRKLFDEMSRLEAVHEAATGRAKAAAWKAYMDFRKKHRLFEEIDLDDDEVDEGNSK